MRYLILGVTEARDETGAPLPLGGARLRALLTALALRAGRPGPVPVAVLVDEVWGEAPPLDAPAALQALVARLRRALGGRDTVRADPTGGYRLAADRDDTDLHRFGLLADRGARELDTDPATAARTLRTALGLWRGPALADLPQPVRAAHAAGPEARRAAALRDRIEADLRCGATAPAVLLPELQVLIQENPYDEPLRAQHLRALRAAGRPADALAAYERARRTLADGLGTDPGPELRALHAELLHPAPPPPPPPTTPGPPPPPPTPSGRPTPPPTPSGRPTPPPADPASPSPPVPTAQPGSPAPPGSAADPAAPAAPPQRGAPPGAPGPLAPTAPLGAAAPSAPAGATRAAAASAPPEGPGWSAPGGPSAPFGAAAPPGTPGPAEASVPPGVPGAPDAPTASTAPRGNLRPRLNSFVGREPELAALRTGLAELRLITLTGPGGSGKTRLAEHAALDHPDTGWLVELARLDHPAAVPDAVLSALGLRESSLLARDTPTTDDPAARLVEHCAHRRLLLVLDNCEHVIGAAAELAELLLTRCPGVRILATSREPLGIPGEHVRPVEPLPPDPAHRLFADRGAAARPGFTPADDPAAVAEICARLDGLPLAIELAAARLRLLTPRQIAHRLDDRFRLLTGGARTVLPRQQTLRAVVDWSWDLLDDAERTVLRSLSVFAGGWDLEAAEAVCADPAAAYDTADVLGSLVDKSLVLAEPEPGPGPGPAPDGPGMRYRMLETIHEYATERATARPADRDTAARRHAAHYLALAERAEPLIRSAAQLPWIRRLETELDNLRAALSTAEAASDPDTAQRLVAALGWFLWLRNYRAEGAEWAARGLALTPADAAEGTPAYWHATRLHLLRMFLLAESRPVENLRTATGQALAARIKETYRHGSPETTRFPGMLWPATAFLTGDVTDFRTDLDTALDNCRRHGGDWEVGVTLLMRTHVAIDTAGGLPTVDADLAELHAIARRVGDRWLRAQVASAAGEAALSRGQYGSARTEYEECLRLAREVGAHVEAPFALARIAEATYRSGDYDTSERLLAEADREAEEHGGVYDVSTFARLLGALLALTRGDFDRAAAEYARAQAETERITVPAQLSAALGTVGAVLTARADGPEAGLARIRPVLAAGVAAHCAERFLAGIAEAAALLLADAGRPAESVRALAAATAWRAGQPRSVPEETALKGLPDRNRALLGPARYAAQEAAGAALSPESLAAQLTGS